MTAYSKKIPLRKTVMALFSDVSLVKNYDLFSRRILYSVLKKRLNVALTTSCLKICKKLKF